MSALRGSAGSGASQATSGKRRRGRAGTSGLGRSRAPQVGVASASSIFSVGTNGKRSVMCAGTPCWADAVVLRPPLRRRVARPRAPRRSSALRGTGRRVRSGVNAAAAEPVAPARVVAARALGLPARARVCSRRSGRLGRRSRGAAGAGARDHPPRRDRRCPDDLARGPAARRLDASPAGTSSSGRSSAGSSTDRSPTGSAASSCTGWPRSALGQLVPTGAAPARLRRGAARALAALVWPFGSRSTEATSSGPAAPTRGPASGSSTC